MDDSIASGYRELTLSIVDLLSDRRSDTVITPIVNSVVSRQFLLTSDWKSLSYGIIWIIKHKNTMYHTICSPVCNECISALSPVSDCCHLVSPPSSASLCHLGIIYCSWKSSCPFPDVARSMTAVASLGLVSPRAETDGVTLFFLLKTDNLFSVVASGKW